MAALQKVALGTPPAGADGDTTRTGFTKLNANVDALTTQATLGSVALSATTLALASTHTGKRLIVNAAASATYTLPQASTCAADSVLMVVNTSGYTVTLTPVAGDAATNILPVGKYESLLVQCDGAKTWTALYRGRAASADEVVTGTLTAASAAIGNTLTAGAASVTGTVTAANVTVTGEVVIGNNASPGDSDGQLTLHTANNANGLQSLARFHGTFATGADLGVRYIASLRSGFSTGTWGTEYLDVYMNPGTPNDKASNSAQSQVVRFAYKGSTFYRPVTFSGALTASAGATVTGGLAADTVLASTSLTAGATTINGPLTSSGGATFSRQATFAFGADATQNVALTGNCAGTGPSGFVACTSGGASGLAAGTVIDGGHYTSSLVDRSESAFFGVRTTVGSYTDALVTVLANGSWSQYSFRSNGSAYAGSGSWVNSSDERLKTGIERIGNPLALMSAIKGCTWTRRDTGRRGIGFIAQDVQAVLPDAVDVASPERTLPDGTVINDELALDTGGVAAALHHEAILALMQKVDTLEREVAALKAAAA